jgi:hypothetical protein
VTQERSCEHGPRECLSCRKVRWGTVRTASSATPSRHIASKPGVRPKDRPLYNSWEAGRPTDDRGVPFLSETGVVVQNKEFAETRRKWRRS